MRRPFRDNRSPLRTLPFLREWRAFLRVSPDPACVQYGGSTTAMALRPLLLILALMALVAPGAHAQTASFDGAWIEDGESCAAVYVASGKTLAFRRPANAFVAAFAVSGRRLSTPLAHCRIDRVTPQGERQVMQLSCTTSISTNTARAIFAPAPNGGLNRYSTAEGGIATRYVRCTPETLKAP